MSLSNMEKNVINNLFNMIELNKETYQIDEIRNDYSTYGKLELLAKQMTFLKLEALNIIDEYKINKNINSIKCNFKKVPGTYYYHYIINDCEVLSLINNNEWDTYDKFLGKYYYDYDFTFKIIN